MNHPGNINASFISTSYYLYEHDFKKQCVPSLLHYYVDIILVFKYIIELY
jgi:hypothetical protein